MAGGGTGGHVIPLLAVARELRQRGHEVIFVGTERGLEAKLVPAEGFELEKISIGGLNRVGWRRRGSTLVRLPLATARSVGIARGVAGVFSLGGYVAGPPVAAALLRRIPVVAMEPNAFPGFTNRVVGRLISRALIAFPETARHFPAGRTELIGLPVREEFFRLPPKPRSETLDLLITGGSQGSRTLNQAARQSWPLFRKAGLAVRIVHQTGEAQHEELREEFARYGIPGRVTPFIEAMADAFAQADLVVCRSGAGAVAELAAAGKASVLVPLPYAANDHQARNAEALERAGAARMVRDAEMNGERLFAAVCELAGAAGALERMAAAAREMAHPGAARRAAEILEEAGRHKSRFH